MNKANNKSFMIKTYNTEILFNNKRITELESEISKIDDEINTHFICIKEYQYEIFEFKLIKEKINKELEELNKQNEENEKAIEELRLECGLETCKWWKYFQSPELCIKKLKFTWQGTRVLLVLQYYGSWSTKHIQIWSLDLTGILI